MAYRTRTKAEKNIPIWAKKVRGEMEKRGLSQKQLAQELHCNATELCGVLNGLRFSKSLEERICEFFKIER